MKKPNFVDDEIEMPLSPKMSKEEIHDKSFKLAFNQKL